MVIVGLEKFSTVDYPGHIAAVVFLGGCNMNCGFCHNLDTAVKHVKQNINVDDVLAFLEKRKGLLQAVCVSGGEPTLHGDELVGFIKAIKDMGYKIKLDTNGSRPEIVKVLLNNKLIDYIAMDIKAPWDKYEEICRCPVNVDNIKETMNLINSSGVSYEYRTTYVPVLSVDDIKQIAFNIKGSDKYVLQQFRQDNAPDNMLEVYGAPHNKDYIANTVKEIQSLVGNVHIRGV